MIRNHTLDLVVHQPKVSWRVYTGFWTPEKHLFAVCGWTRLVSFPRPLHLQILAKTKQKIISHQLYNIPLIMHVISIHCMYMYYKIWKCPQESGMYMFMQKISKFMHINCVNISSKNHFKKPRNEEPNYHKDCHGYRIHLKVGVAEDYLPGH